MIKGRIRAIHSDVLVKDMYFGETKTAGGIIIHSDDAKVHGIKPRWAQVYTKGPENSDPYQVGDWILVEHGRWTRKIKIEDDSGEKLELQKVEQQAILAWQNDAPSNLAYFGKGYNDGATASFDPGLFLKN